MEESASELTACCGLYCGDCIRYKSRAADLARDLVKDLQNTGFEEYARFKSGASKQFDAVKQFEHYPDCLEVLEAIAALQCNQPCRVGGGCPTFSCNILECCRKKGFEGCWECNEFENCDKFEPLYSCHGDAPRKNLKKIRELGLDGWVEQRCKPYIWQ